jgi:hypothetical protein
MPLLSDIGLKDYKARFPDTFRRNGNGYSQKWDAHLLNKYLFYVKAETVFVWFWSNPWGSSGGMWPDCGHCKHVH